MEIAFLIPNGYWHSTVTAGSEVFEALQLHALSGAFKHGSQQVPVAPRVTFLRMTEKHPRSLSGMLLETQALADIPNTQFDFVMIPTVWSLSYENLTSAPEALTWLVKQHSGGAVMVGIVTGMFYLAEAGLLNGRLATTHWASVDVFSQRYPDVELDHRLELTESNNIFCVSGIHAYMDLVLQFIRQAYGPEVSDFTNAMEQNTDPLPSAVRSYVLDNLAGDLSHDRLAEMFHVSPRTLARRFSSVFKVSPATYVSEQRIVFAKQLLLSSRLPIERIAKKCGYMSHAVFTRRFTNSVGKTPRDFRNTR